MIAAPGGGNEGPRMRMRSIVLGCLLWAAGGLPAATQTPPGDCSEGTSTVEISQCFERELTRADAELNRAYQVALKGARDDSALPATLKGKWEAALRDAQRKWVTFRDADCKELIGYEWYGGTGMGSAVLSCMVEKTKARSKELLARYDH
jgi:uncharacterized protein YecT (DUF1311 family)